MSNNRVSELEQLLHKWLMWWLGEFREGFVCHYLPPHHETLMALRDDVDALDYCSACCDGCHGHALPCYCHCHSEGDLEEDPTELNTLRIRLLKAEYILHRLTQEIRYPSITDVEIKEFRSLISAARAYFQEDNVKP